jgi:two-component system response regulator YcbB
VKILIIEDDLNIIKILEKIIDDRGLGLLLGYATDGLEGEKKIQALKPDIVLIDLLMPGKDGISLVRDAKIMFPEMQFIMISQVSAKDMVGKAYEKGVEYYINKPINALEVQNVIRKVTERMKMNRTLNQIQKLFVTDHLTVQSKEEEDVEFRIKNIMQRLGILGQAGSQDIIEIVAYLLNENKNIKNYTVRDVCSHFTDNPKSMEQRIRRTAFLGMINLANLGIEDYMNEVFTEYSNSLYSFEQIKKEMDFIRGKSKQRGKVNLKKFLEGMMFYCQK